MKREKVTKWVEQNQFCGQQRLDPIVILAGEYSDRFYARNGIADFFTIVSYTAGGVVPAVPFQIQFNGIGEWFDVQSAFSFPYSLLQFEPFISFKIRNLSTVTLTININLSCSSFLFTELIKD